MSKEGDSNVREVGGFLATIHRPDNLEAERIIAAQMSTKEPRYISCAYLDERGEWEVGSIYFCKNLRKASDDERAMLRVEMQRADLVHIFDGDTV